jgi:hypothetical protein
MEQDQLTLLQNLRSFTVLVDIGKGVKVWLRFIPRIFKCMKVSNDIRNM